MASKKDNIGLGKGIGALFGGGIEAFETVDLENEKVEEIDLDDIRPNPYQPRQTFDDVALEELAQSIQQTGVFQPVILRRSRVKGYEIVAGERRVRASKLAGKATIPAIVRQLDESLMVEIAVVENLQREDLNPLEEAQAYDTMISKLNLTQAEVAQRLGKSRPYIANYIRLLGLPNAVKSMLENNELSMGHARTLLGLDSAEQMIAFAKKVIKEDWTVRHLEEMIQQEKAPKQTKTKMKKVARPSYLVECEDKLMDKFGTSVLINDKGDKGKIEIEYLSVSDLTRILEILDVELD